MLRQRGPRRGEAGYTLAALVIAVTVMSILVAAALPYWSKVIQREKEEELIARGLQYAEAIRVFRARFGRLPTTLQELMDVKPRSIRQLWRDPMTESGEWGLIFESGPTPVAPIPGQQPVDPNGRPTGGPQGPTGGGNSLFGPGSAVDAAEPTLPTSNLAGSTEDGATVTLGPIKGVVSLSKKQSIKIFFDKDQHNQWQFTYDLLISTVGFNTPAGGGVALGTRIQWLGRPWRPGIVPPGGLPGQNPGGVPGQQPGGFPPGGQPSTFPPTPDTPLPPGVKPPAGPVNPDGFPQLPSGEEDQ